MAENIAPSRQERRTFAAQHNVRRRCARFTTPSAGDTREEVPTPSVTPPPGIPPSRRSSSSAAAAEGAAHSVVFSFRLSSPPERHVRQHVTDSRPLTPCLRQFISVRPLANPPFHTPPPAASEEASRHAASLTPAAAAIHARHFLSAFRHCRFRYFPEPFTSLLRPRGEAG